MKCYLYCPSDLRRQNPWEDLILKLFRAKGVATNGSLGHQDTLSYSEGVR